MTADVQCPNCGETHRLPDDFAVDKLHCTRCGHAFTLSIALDETIDLIAGEPNDGLPAGSALPSSSAPSSSPSPPADDELPAMVGPYVVRRRLGAGAMGVVYLAHDAKLERDVAVKVLPPAFSQDEESRKRFLREARLAARLHHTNTATVYQAEIEGGVTYIAMEYVDGTSLDAVVSQNGPLEWREAARVIRDAAEGLHAAHELGLVHRDVKPANLIRSMDGVTKVVDFGLARAQKMDAQLTQRGMLLGTPAFMAPEQWEGTQVDARSDLYSLSCTYYFLLTGRVPFDGASLPSLGYQHKFELFPDARAVAPEMPDEVGRILARGSEKDPRQRIQTAKQLVAELVRILNTPDDLLTFGTLDKRLIETSDFDLAESNSPAHEPVDVDVPADYSKTASKGKLRLKDRLPNWAWIGAGVGVVVLLSLLLPALLSTFSAGDGTGQPNPRAKPVVQSGTGRDDQGPAPILHFEFEGNAKNSGTLGARHGGTEYGDGFFTNDAVRGEQAYCTAATGYILVPTTKLGDQITIAAWVKLDDGVSGIQGILSSWTSEGGGFSLALNSWTRDDRIVLLETWSQSGEANQVRTVENAVDYLQWHHVAITIDRTASSVDVYVDGDSAQLQAANFDSDFTDNKPLSIGRYYGTPSVLPFHFSGRIDDLRVYDKTLSAGEIKTLAHLDSRPGN